jgi:hypothetical protein
MNTRRSSAAHRRLNSCFASHCLPTILSLRCAGRPVCLLSLLICLVPAILAQQTIHIATDRPTIQAGINAAANGDTVLVAPGTYYENIDFKGKAITVTSSAGPATTIIDGSGTAGMPVVLFQTQELRTSVLSGFTIQHGGTQTFTSQPSGGIFVHFAAPTIRGNIVSENRCSGIYAAGGALIQGNIVSATQYNNFNSQDSYCQQTGTGVVVEGAASVGGYHNEVIGNTIQNNTQALGAGGIEINAAEGTLIQGNIISNNSGMIVGGIGTVGTQAVSIIQNLIYQNSSTGSGYERAGGISISSPQNGASTPPKALIAQNTLSGNSLQNGIAGETATELSLSGATSGYTVVNNILAGSSSSVPAINCSVAYASLSPTPVVIDHNDIYNSAGSAYGGACSDQTGSLGNLSANPNFVSPGADFHLVISSPVIDTGNNSAPDLPSTDLDGNPRIQDATHKGYPVVDMGAYEYPGLLDGGSVTTTLTSSLNPSAYGQSVTFTATVTDASSTTGAPTGTVTFTDGTTILATQPLNSTNSTTASASFATGVLSGGSHSITATYNPATGSPSSASLVQIVTGITTTASLTSSLNPAPYGSSVAFTAIVTSASNSAGAPTGTIRFMDGSAVLATQQLVSSDSATSRATLSTAALSVGSHILSAVYVPSGAFVASTATLTETINGYSPTTTTLTGSPNPAILGNTATFFSSVTSTSPGAGPPTGAVTLTVGGSTVLGTQTLVASSSTTSQASFAVNTLPVGGQGILASYNATGNFMGSTAAITEWIVPPPDFTIALASPSITIQTQHHLTTTVTVTSLNGFADSLTLTCANLPTYLTCRPTPAIATLAVANGTATVSLYLDTNSVLGYARNTPTSSPGRSPSPITWALLLSPFGLFAGLAPWSRRRLQGHPCLRLLILVLAILPLSLTLSGCGPFVFRAYIPPSVGPGTYTIPITATDAATGLGHTAQLIVTVTP